MEKINISKLLKYCQQGMELDCTMYEDVYFDYVDELNIIHCYIKNECFKTSITFNQYGTPNSNIKSKCVIFPKGKTTWKGFVPPFDFNDGDILYCDANDDGDDDDCYKYVFMLKEINENRIIAHCFICGYRFTFKETYLVDNTHPIRFATEEEKSKLFQAIKDYGYEWDNDSKCFNEITSVHLPTRDNVDKIFKEKHEPKFKVGDKVRGKYTNKIYTISSITPTEYKLTNGLSFIFSAEDCHELVSDKFDITTLKPFESKVLVRNDKYQKWIPAFWGYKHNDGYTTTFGRCKYCIPFDGNENLLGTSDDCDEFYKI